MATRPGEPTWAQPPFPVLTGDEFGWVGPDRLPAWAGFQMRGGPYGARSGAGPSTGDVRVSVEPPAAGGPPSVEQAAAYAHLKADGPAVTAAVLAAIADKYPSLVELYLYDEETAAELMPPVSSPDDLRPLVGPNTVHVLNMARDGSAYFGIEFGCTWDEEHGLGVLCHRDRVIDVGSADVSFGAGQGHWLAVKDGGSKIVKAG